ncbi:uncharacterized protein LOC111122612 [Crassostrea virginica]
MYFNFLKMDFLNFEYMYLILSFILCGYCDTSNKHRSFWEISIMRNRSRHLNIMFTEKTRSKIECGIQCTLPCKSFSYNHETFTCRGYDVMISDNASSVLEGGWRTYGVQATPTLPPTTETSAIGLDTTTQPVTESVSTEAETTLADTTVVATTTSTTTITTTTITTTTTTTIAAPSCVSCPVGYTCRISILFCYKYYPTRKARADAEAQCAGEGAELAIIDNVDKDNEIFSYINSISTTETFYWVQGRYFNNEWRYDDGTLVTYFRWAPGHPFKLDLLAFNQDNGFHGTTDQYNDVFFCEVKL